MDPAKILNTENFCFFGGDIVNLLCHSNYSLHKEIHYLQWHCLYGLKANGRFQVPRYLLQLEVIKSTSSPECFSYLVLWKKLPQISWLKTKSVNCSSQCLWVKTLDRVWLGGLRIEVYQTNADSGVGMGLEQGVLSVRISSGISLSLHVIFQIQ